MSGKDPMTADSFDEADYATNLVDKEGYSETTARMLAKKKKESFEAKKIEINLGSLFKSDKADEDEEFEHLSPEERKKRMAERDKRQKERAAHRVVRRKQHEEVESTIPEGKMEGGITLAKAKSKKRVWVKPTASKKGYYREQEVGRKEDEKVSSHEKEMKALEAEVSAQRAQMAEPNEYGIAMQDINEGDCVDLGPNYGGKHYVLFVHDAKRLFVTDKKEDRYKGESADGLYTNLYDVQELLGGSDEDEDDTSLYAPRSREE